LPKIKQSGYERLYTDSFLYEWYVVMDDTTEFSMFNADGSEQSWGDVLAYTPSTSNIDEVGLRPFSVAKAEAINNNQSHQYTVIASSNIEFSRTLTNPQKGFTPYMMKRKQHIGVKIQTFFVVGHDADGSQFFIVNYLGEWQQGDNKLLQWV
jgi:hypothetical protein